MEFIYMALLLFFASTGLKLASNGHLLIAIPFALIAGLFFYLFLSM